MVQSYGTMIDGQIQQLEAIVNPSLDWVANTYNKLDDAGKRNFQQRQQQAQQQIAQLREQKGKIDGMPSIKPIAISLEIARKDPSLNKFFGNDQATEKTVTGLMNTYKRINPSASEQDLGRELAALTPTTLKLIVGVLGAKSGQRSQRAQQQSRDATGRFQQSTVRPNATSARTQGMGNLEQRTAYVQKLAAAGKSMSQAATVEFLNNTDSFMRKVRARQLPPLPRL